MRDTNRATRALHDPEAGFTGPGWDTFYALQGEFKPAVRREFGAEE
jgi:hypothetical protein